MRSPGHWSGSQQLGKQQPQDYAMTFENSVFYPLNTEKRALVCIRVHKIASKVKTLDLADGPIEQCDHAIISI